MFHTKGLKVQLLKLNTLKMACMAALFAKILACCVLQTAKLSKRFESYIHAGNYLGCLLLAKMCVA